MKAETSISNLALIWGNLRNIVDFSSLIIPGYFSLIGTTLGEFPVDSYEPIYLEIPKDGSKLNLLGRHNWSSSLTDRKVSWYEKRLIQLPDYSIKESIEITDLKRIFQTWSKFSIPDNVPCFNLAVSTKGSYCSEGREAQTITVLLLWANGMTRLLHLDCFEGALDDCCTPEWYIKSSKLLTLNIAISQLNNIYKSPPAWDFPRFSIYLNPPCFKLDLNGEKIEIDKKGWKMEWIYDDFSTFSLDLKLIFQHIGVLNH
ncbi:MAG: hypothetical protein ACW981_10380 [Candidatus Hodarchaeales archaeon]|jgi:hypothetical protein